VKTSTNPSRVAVVAGATGMVGRGLAMSLREQGWNVIALSRTPRDFGPSIRSVSVDLLDQTSVDKIERDVTDATHIFYAARAMHADDGAESVSDNASMLRNLIDKIELCAPALRHVHVVQGMKYYGIHLGKFKTPARESYPRLSSEHFYYAQEDALLEAQRGKQWTWTASRPHSTYNADPAIGRNIVLVVASFAAILKELGLPLTFPGRPGHYTCLYQLTHSGLLARAITWMATEERCSNQAFNVVNGDYFRWENIWPRIADYFEMPLGVVEPIEIEKTMRTHEAVWQSMIQRYGLMQRSINWRYADWLFRTEFDVMSSMTKAREFGFDGFVNSEESIFSLFDRFRELKAIP
jgi:nucleoside-diphosphate-sugar epimerase